MRFAEVLHGKVIRVTVSVDGSIGVDWLNENAGGAWVPVSSDIVVGPGYTYDSQRDAFIPPKPFESWVLDETAFLWVAPVDMPDDGQAYVWDESAGEWVVSE